MQVMARSGDHQRERPASGPAGRKSRGAATRGHVLQLWLTAAAIVVLAVLVAVAVTALRRQADHARQEQLIVANLNADAQRISRLEWQATAEGRLSAQVDEEFALVHRRIDRLLREFSTQSESEGRRLDVLSHRYLGAVEKQLALIDAGRVAESEEFDEREVDPSFGRLQEQLQLVDAGERETAQEAAGRTDVGVVGSLLLAAAGLIAALWRLDRIRGRAARERHQELEAQALHDTLTGLPNRRMVVVDLERELLQAEPGDGCVLLLCDLDGFKAYNDTFGHLEGDLLLCRVGDKLARVVAPHGTAYRLGGDEFCALMRVAPDELARVLAACHAALGESGSGFAVRASIGSVALPEEASESSNALRLADLRMYAQKNGRGSSVRRQLRDLILRVLAEKDPALCHHVHDVARLAAGVGRRLGRNDAQVADLVRAAELHDVGKVAIPDSILLKRGRLDSREQQYMRRHTLIGESILSSAPALAGVGRLVRSSHERFDGTGYPDGLRAEEIPLASRIIFVCDSFAAMTTERPYRRAMGEADALTELKRCAATQFDPTVVDAFATEFAALKAARDHEVQERHTPQLAPTPYGISGPAPSR